MMPKFIVFTACAVLLIADREPAFAETSVAESGAMVCVNDKWDEKEIAKGHKLVDYAGPCVNVPDDPAGEKFIEDCVGKYEYMPDESWKGSGTCTLHLKDGKVTAAWEEGSHLKDYTYTYTGGEGPYKGVSGSGTYRTDMLSDRFGAARFKGLMKLP
jgi:hypothetical protein